MDNYAKAKILKMLEDGKISSDDALRLIDAIDGEEPVRNSKQKYDVDYEFEADEIEIEAEKLEEEAEKLEAEAEILEEKLEDGYKNHFDDLEEKAQRIRDKAEEKRSESDEFREKAENFRQKAEELSAEISDKINEKLEGLNFGDFFNFGFDMRESVKREREFNVASNHQITIKNRNGNIKVSKTDKEAYAIFMIKSKRDADDVMKDIVISNDGNLMIDMQFRNGDEIYTRTRVDLELFLPELKYGDMIFKTTNGLVEAADLEANDVNVSSTNGRISVSDIKADQIIAYTTNGKVLSDRNKCKVLNITSTNGSVKANGNECTEMTLGTTNGSISNTESTAKRIFMRTTNGSVKSFRNSSDVHEAITSNAGITFSEFLPLGEKASIQLKTSNGSIKVENRDDVRIDFIASVGKNQKVKGDFKDYHAKGKEHVGSLKKGYDSQKKMVIDLKTSMGNVDFV
ncbi:MAG: DUF4097 family beta strand repeat protein [Clostridia bacterium]|nr:DUF4097 family beta strand repeat protein [Clostridia bacterium]